MTLYQYNALDECEQQEAIWEYASKVAEREDEVYRYVLFSMFDFYIEDKFHKQLDVIYGRRSFNSATQLEPYIDKIDISNLGI